MANNLLSMHSVISKTTFHSCLMSQDGQKIMIRKSLESDQYILVREIDFEEKKIKNDKKEDFYIEPFAIFIRKNGVLRCAVSCRDRCFDNKIKKILEGVL